MHDPSTLQVVWFGLISILWLGYFVLEGFDFGVGMLLRLVGRDEAGKRGVIHTIGPVWDGNEVWLLVAGGATFAAFPELYATLFSGFYVALFVILAALIVRGVAFEFWGKDDNPRWRGTGVSRHSGVGRMLLGDVSRDVLHGSPCPVAVAPKGFSAGAPGTIGVAYDHSPEADKALQLAVDVASALGARVKVRHVVATDLWYGFGGYPIPGLEDITKEILSDAEERMRVRIQELDTAATIDAEAVAGGTSEQLEELADHVDLLVCGSRAWGSIKRVVLGSTADRLIHHASCPVLVMPRTADSGAAGTPVETSSATA